MKYAKNEICYKEVEYIYQGKIKRYFHADCFKNLNKK